MKIFRKKRCNNGRMHIYFCGLKIISYQRQNPYMLNISRCDTAISKFRKSGINKKSRKQKIIVSMTSFPARINRVHYAIFSLLNQTVKPDEIVLWLGCDEFPHKEKDLPDTLLNLRKHGISIKWCKDIRSYKKLIPALKEYPDDIIITVDDDIYYKPNLIKKLIKEYKKHSSEICCHRVTKIIYKNNSFHTIAGGQDFWHGGSYLNKQTGVGGVLYPPKCFYSDILNEELFMKLAPTNDDQWFWCMAVLNGTKIRVVKKPEYKLQYIPDTQEVGLCNVNDNGPRLFWVQFDNLLAAYPDFRKKLISEQKKNSKE